MTATRGAARSTNTAIRGASRRRRLSLPLLLLAAACAGTPSALAPYWQNYTQTGIAELAARAQALDAAADAACGDAAAIDPSAPPATLTDAFRATALAWADIRGIAYPGIEANRLTFRLYFWPDVRDRTSATLDGLLTGNEALNAAALASAPAAAEGIGAVEWLLYAAPANTDSARYCDLLTAVTARFAGHVGAVEDYQAERPLVAPEWLRPDARREGNAVSLNLLVEQIDGLVGDLRASTDENGRFTEGAHGWRSGLTGELYARTTQQIAAHLRATGVAPALSQDTAAALATASAELTGEATALASADLAAYETGALGRHLAAARTLLDEEVASELDVMIGFNNSDGD